MSKLSIPPILPGMIDTHFHALHTKNKGLRINQILTDCFHCGLFRAVDIGTEPDDIKSRLDILRDFEGVRFTVGCSPGMVEHENPDDLTAVIKRNAEQFPVIAIGEIGLDWYWMHGTKEAQEALFAAQIDLANRLDLPIVIHVRDAHSDAVRILREHTPINGGVVHCFSGGHHEARQYVDMGMKISFSGSVTFKNAINLRDAAVFVPDNALLAETDSPFLSPEPVRGQVNHPGRVALVYSFLAAVRGRNLSSLIQAIHNNFTQQFGE